MSRKDKPRLEAMRLRRDQVERLTAVGCVIKPHMDLTPPTTEVDKPNPSYDVLLPNNSVVRVKVNRGEAIIRRTHDKKSAHRYEEGFARKLTWVRDENGTGKVTGFTIQFDH